MSRPFCLLLAIGLAMPATRSAAQDAAEPRHRHLRGRPGCAAARILRAACQRLRSQFPILRPSSCSPRTSLRASSATFSLRRVSSTAEQCSTEGVVWRIFGIEPGADGALPLLGTVEGGAARISIQSGEYLVHAAFGRAGITKRVIVTDDNQRESLILNAGGMKLDAVVGEDQAIASERLSFEILQEDVNGELATVIPQRRAGTHIAACCRHLPCHQPLWDAERRSSRGHPGRAGQADRGGHAAYRRAGDAEAGLRGRRRSVRQHGLDRAQPGRQHDR